LRDVYPRFEARKVAVLGVSFDSPKSNAEFAEDEQFPFALLSDGDRALAVQVGAADDVRQMFSRRISYLVDVDGKVLQVYTKVDPATHAETVLKDLESLD
jgi:peroxiredoxin Q/BCP